MKVKPKILFRTAGGQAKKQELGMGHIIRSMNLAIELRKKAKIFFLIEDFGGAKKTLQNQKFLNINKIENNVNLEKDIDITNKMIQKFDIDILIVDRYNVKQKFLNEMKKQVKIVLISDLKNINYNVDLLINGFIGFKNQIYLNKFNSRCLLGPRYQILNKKFQTKNHTKKEKFSILVTMGGYDEKQIAKRIIYSLKDLFKKNQIHLILGPATKISNELKKFEKENIIIIHKNVKNMNQIISRSNFGICTGGLTTYEFATTGIPFTIICDDKHQLLTAKEWEKRNVAINLKLFNKNTEKKLLDVINKKLKNKIKLKSGKKFVDGFGVSRTSTEILKILD